MIAGAHPRDLLDDEAGGQGVGALTAVFLGDVRRVEPGDDERVVRLGGGSSVGVMPGELEVGKSSVLDASFGDGQ